MHHGSTVLVRLVADKTKVGLIETTCIKLLSIREVSVIYIRIYVSIWFGCIRYVCIQYAWLRVHMYACFYMCGIPGI